MQINNQGNNLRVHFPANKPNSSAGNVESGRVDSSTAAEPQRLSERLELDSKVRNQLLVEIKAKIQAGEYSTRAAAVEAAQNIVE